MDFNERVIPNVSANFLYQEALARYVFASKQIGQSKKVIDYGCGTGYGTALLAKKNRVVGIDSDLEAITYAQKYYGEDIHFVVQKRMDAKADHVDAICSFEVIEHLKSPLTFLRDAKQLLKKNGVLILSTPNKLAPIPENSTKSPYHVREYTYNEFLNLLKSVFPNAELYGQNKNAKAKNAFSEFMKSQVTRQSFVNADTFNIRKLFPKKIKEKIWKYVGAFYGRQKQESLSTADFPILKKNVESAEYFVAVCRK